MVVFGLLLFRGIIRGTFFRWVVLFYFRMGGKYEYSSTSSFHAFCPVLFVSVVQICEMMVACFGTLQPG